MDLDSHLCYTTFIPLNISVTTKAFLSHIYNCQSLRVLNTNLEITSSHPKHEQTLLLQHFEVFSTLDDSVVLSSQSQHMHSTTACSCWVTS